MLQFNSLAMSLMLTLFSLGLALSWRRAVTFQAADARHWRARRQYHLMPETGGGAMRMAADRLLGKAL